MVELSTTKALEYASGVPGNALTRREVQDAMPSPKKQQPAKNPPRGNPPRNPPARNPPPRNPAPNCKRDLSQCFGRKLVIICNNDVPSRSSTSSGQLINGKYPDPKVHVPSQANAPTVDCKQIMECDKKTLRLVPRGGKRVLCHSLNRFVTPQFERWMVFYREQVSFDASKSTRRPGFLIIA